MSNKLIALLQAGINFIYTGSIKPEPPKDKPVFTKGISREYKVVGDRAYARIMPSKRSRWRIR